MALIMPDTCGQGCCGPFGASNDERGWGGSEGEDSKERTCAHVGKVGAWGCVLSIFELFDNVLLGNYWKIGAGTRNICDL